MIRFVCLVLAVAAVACAENEPLRDTGYVGTWERGQETLSRLAIVERDGKYLIRRSVFGMQGGPRVQCDWNGHCNEFVDGEKTAEYEIRSFVDPETGHLRIECNGTVFKPEAGTVHYIDEMLLKDDGLRIRARTLQRGGRVYPPGFYPKRDYRKVSNSVKDPPPGA